MSDNRVVWTEGMFLRVQHFQQADRWTQGLVAASTGATVPFAWGVSTLEINRSLLGTGRFGLAATSGILPDGTVFEAPGSVDLPPPLDLAEGVKNRTVYLALPTRQEGNVEIGSADAGANAVRFDPHRTEIFDANAGSANATPIETARLRLRLKLEGDDLSGFERIAIARIEDVSADQSVRLDETFTPTALNCAAAKPLSDLVAEVLGIVSHRAEAIADRMGDPSVRGTAEVSDFQFLQVLNRYEATLRHSEANAGSLHPERLYRTLVELAGEISVFTKERRRGAVFPGYRHPDLGHSFEPVAADIRTSLSTVLERSAVEIPLEERKHGVRVGVVQDRGLLSSAGFVLAVRADLPQEALRTSFPRQSKLGPVERIAELVNVALPGIPVAPLPVAPRQLPYRPGTSYFELDKDTPLWAQLRSTGGLALHLAGDFPSIEIELWAIKG